MATSDVCFRHKKFQFVDEKSLLYPLIFDQKLILITSKKIPLWREKSEEWKVKSEEVKKYPRNKSEEFFWVEVPKKMHTIL